MRVALVYDLRDDYRALGFWRGVELAGEGDVEAGRHELQIAFAADSRWRTTLQHLADAGQQGLTPELAELLLA